MTPATAVPYDPNSTNDSGDGTSVTVGVKFTSDVFGQVSGIRFYKASTNTGTHVGSLWSSSGQLLASATFTNETTSGWQTVTFSTPVTVLPGTTYVAALLCPQRALFRYRRLLLRQPGTHADGWRKSEHRTSARRRFHHQRERRVQLRVERALSRQHRRGKLLGRRRLLAVAGARPGHRGARHRRQRHGTRDLERAHIGRTGNSVHDHAVYRQHGAGADDCQRYPAAHWGRDQRIDRRNAVHVHGHRQQPGRRLARFPPRRTRSLRHRPADRRPSCSKQARTAAAPACQ